MESPRSARGSFLAAFIAVAFVYIWTATSDKLSWHFGAEQTDYYNLLVDGFLEGHLSLKAEVPSELLQLPDPYDPATRPAGVALHDASLYRGKYYIYYGVVPAVVVLLPFRVVTGIDLPMPLAVLALALLAYGLALRLLAELRGRFFPQCGTVTTFLIACGVGFASMTPLLVRRGSMYELPIVSGSLFALVALYALYRAAGSSRRPLLWLATSSLAWGLAIGCRPTYLIAPATLALLVPIFRRKMEQNDASFSWGKIGIAALLPIAVIGALLALYNYARFGSPTEFGVRYILSGVYESKIEHFRLRYVPWNAFAYFLAPGEWGRYFPFFHEATITLPRPLQHFGMDLPFGLLWHVPFVWLAPVAVLSFRSPAAGEDRTALRLIVWALAWASLVVAGFLLCFYAAMARYFGDFAPALALLSAIGAMTVIHAANASKAAWRRWWVGAGITGCAVVSGFTVFVFSLEAYNRFRPLNPAGYAAIARVANAPIHVGELLVGRLEGALTMRIVLPTIGQDGRRETILATGWAGATDRISLIDASADAVILEFEHAGAPPIRSVPIRVDRSREHRLRVAMGSLFPPPTWPGYDDWMRPQQLAVQRRLEVTWDSEVVLSRYQRFHDATPTTLVVGDRLGFSGRTLDVLREPVAAPTLTGVEQTSAAEEATMPADGRLVLEARLPTAAAGREPLIVSGETGRADFIAVEFLGHGQIRFYHDHWGSRGVFSAPLACDLATVHTIEVSHPVYRGSREPEGDLVVRMDGRVVWSVRRLFYPVDPEDIFIGGNPVGGSSCREAWTGMLKRIR